MNRKEVTMSVLRTQAYSKLFLAYNEDENKPKALEYLKAMREEINKLSLNIISGDETSYFIAK